LDIGDADTLRQEERGIGVAQIMRFTVGQAAGYHHGTPDLCGPFDFDKHRLLALVPALVGYEKIIS
jgi:hypothetical protein